ncbi:translation initiation factor 2 [Psychrobacillus sp. BM2]|uniref:translation initiation factor 2 n=1 Tax=Psychrobacillus sp. BM2 TaxID=3400421 RepID=UPI003B0186C0
MTNNENNNDQKDQESNEISTLELAVWGELLSTLGDVISTIAAVQALKEEQQEQVSNNNMQKQIDYLTNEVKLLKKQINNGRSWHS